MHGCIVEDCDGNDAMDIEDDCSRAGNSGDLQHNLCDEKAENDCEEPQVDGVFESNVGENKCQLKGTLKLFECFVAYTCVV